MYFKIFNFFFKIYFFILKIKVEEKQKNLHFKPGAAIQNKQTKKDDLKIIKTNKVFESRFEEKNWILLLKEMV